MHKRQGRRPRHLLLQIQAVLHPLHLLLKGAVITLHHHGTAPTAPTALTVPTGVKRKSIIHPHHHPAEENFVRLK